MSDRKFKRSDFGVVILAFFTLCIGTIYLVPHALERGPHHNAPVFSYFAPLVRIVGKPDLCHQKDEEPRSTAR